MYNIHDICDDVWQNKPRCGKGKVGYDVAKLTSTSTGLQIIFLLTKTENNAALLIISWKTMIDAYLNDMQMYACITMITSQGYTCNSIGY